MIFLSRIVFAILFRLLLVFFTVTQRIEHAVENASADARVLHAQLSVWAMPNPLRTYNYAGRHHKPLGRRRLRAVVQEADVARIRRGFGLAA